MLQSLIIGNMNKHIETILIKHRFNYIEETLVRQGKNQIISIQPYIVIKVFPYHTKICILYYSQLLKPVSHQVRFVCMVNILNGFFQSVRLLLLVPLLEVKSVQSPIPHYTVKTDDLK